MKIMLFDECAERALCLRFTLEHLGHEIVAEIDNAQALYGAVQQGGFIYEVQHVLWTA